MEYALKIVINQSFNMLEGGLIASGAEPDAVNELIAELQRIIGIFVEEQIEFGKEEDEDEDPENEEEE